MSNGPLRTIPLRTRGRFVGLAGSFLGQDQANANRLYNISIPAILGRIQLAPQIQAYLAYLTDQKNQAAQGPYSRGMAYGYRGPTPTPPDFPSMTDQEKQTLFEIAQNPTDDELKDLALIDNAFTQHYLQSFLTTAAVCDFLNVANQYKGIYGQSQGGGGAGFGSQPRYLFGNQQYGNANSTQALKDMADYFFVPPAQSGGQGQGWLQRQSQPALPDSSFLKNKFYCSLGVSQSSNQSWSSTDYVSMFGLDTNQPWGGLKLPLYNAQVILDEHAKYPFPPPVDSAPQYFWNYTGTDLPKIANVGQPVDPEAIRAWITMSTLQYYDDMSNAIIAEAKREAKKKKRQAIIKAIALTVASIVASFILPAVIAAAVSLIKLAVETYIDLKQRREAAKAMADAAKMFETDAPAFASEVQKTADLMDASTAEAQANVPLTPEQSAAVQEVQAETPTTPVGHYVVGGVAAGGIVAALVALLR